MGKWLLLALLVVGIIAFPAVSGIVSAQGCYEYPMAEPLVQYVSIQGDYPVLGDGNIQAVLLKESPNETSPGTIKVYINRTVTVLAGCGDYYKLAGTGDFGNVEGWIPKNALFFSEITPIGLTAYPTFTPFPTQIPPTPIQTAIPIVSTLAPGEPKIAWVSRRFPTRLFDEYGDVLPDVCLDPEAMVTVDRQMVRDGVVWYHTNLGWVREEAVTFNALIPTVYPTNTPDTSGVVSLNSYLGAFVLVGAPLYDDLTLVNSITHQGISMFVNVYAKFVPDEGEVLFNIGSGWVRETDLLMCVK